MYSSKSVRRSHDPLETLEKILNKTTLSTQRLSHVNIIDIGGDMLSKTTDNNLEGFERSIQEAVDAAEVRSTRELQAALTRLRHQKDEEKTRALQKQKDYAERHAKRISDQRDRAEEERMKDLIHTMELEKDAALERQWEDAERLKEKAIEEACLELRRKLEAQHAIDKNRAVVVALEQAKVEYDCKEQETIAATRIICEAEASMKAAEEEAKHQEHVEKLNKRYDIMKTRYENESMHKAKIVKDFLEIQDDYKRFLDYTDGHFHSDYLMSLRNQKFNLPRGVMDHVTYHDIKRL